MSLHIIIDGYNLIRQSAELSILDRRDMQSGREALLKMLSAYRSLKPHKITVIFDGAAAPAYYQRRDRANGVSVVFSAPGQTADSLIKNMAAQKRERALVVSSDRDISRFAERQGAAVVGSLEFEQLLTRAVLMESGDSGAEEPEQEPSSRVGTRKKGPSRRLSKKERRHRKKINKL
ncbi:MAG: NYN domain-containing protein [Desulfosudaceae bacterium]